MMRREPRCEASGGKSRFSDDGAEASREQQQQIMVPKVQTYPHEKQIMVPLDLHWGAQRGSELRMK